MLEDAGRAGSGSEERAAILLRGEAEADRLARLFDDAVANDPIGARAAQVQDILGRDLDTITDGELVAVDDRSVRSAQH